MRRPSPPPLACLALTLAMALAGRVSAASPDEPLRESVEELFLGEAVFVQEQWEVQPVGRLQFLGDEVSLGIASELGLTDRIQVELEAEGEARFERTTEYGPTSLGLSVLGNVHSSETAGNALTLGAELETASFTSGLGEDAHTLTPVVIGHQRLGPLHVNATFGVELERADEEDSLELAVVPIVSLLVPCERVVIVAEVGASFAEQHTWSASAGLLWHPTEALELGAAALGTRTNAESEFGGQLLIAYEWELSENEDTD
jgi:hypothetical protein